VRLSIATYRTVLNVRSYLTLWINTTYSILLVYTLTLLVTALLFSYSANAQSVLRTTQYTRLEGLPNNVITALYQDKQGYVWVGTLLGLARYDGYNFTSYRRQSNDSSSLGAVTVTCITEDKLGNIWVGSQNEGLSRYSPQTRSWTRFTPEQKNGLTELQITSLACDSAGKIWVGTPSGLLYYDNTRLRFEEIPIITTYKLVYNLTSVGKDYILFATGNNTVCRVKITKPSEQKLVIVPIQLSFPIATWIQPLRPPKSSGNQLSVIIGSANQNNKNVIELDVSSMSINELKIPRSSNNLTSESCEYASIGSDDKQLIWQIERKRLPTQEQKLVGIRVFASPLRDSTSNQPFSNQAIPKQKHKTIQKLPTNEMSFVPQADVWHYMKDKISNNIYWLGTIRGLTKVVVSNARFTSYRNDPNNSSSLSDNYVRAFATDGEQNVWIGTTTGIAKLIDDKPVNVSINGFDILTQQKIRSIRVNTLVQNPYAKNSLFVGTNTGLFTFDTKTYQIARAVLPMQLEATSLSGTSSDTTRSYILAYSRKISTLRIWSILYDKRGWLWIGTNGRGLFRWKSATSQPENFPTNLLGGNSQGNQVWSLVEDNNGNVWAGTEQGALKWSSQSNNFTRYSPDITKPYSICGNVVWDMYRDENNDVWFMCYGDGISKYRPQTDDFESITVADGLPSPSLTALITDGDGALWMSSYDGLIQHKVGSKVFRVFNETDGLQGDEYTFKCALRTNDINGKNRRLLFGGLNGMSIFDPGNLRSTNPPPPIAITLVQVNGAHYKSDVVSGDTIELRYSENAISFEFSALDYTNPPANRYTHILEGLESNWSTDNDLRRASYSNLEPGTYTFKVRASNSDDTWNEKGCTITIIITPPWWGTWWFRTLAIISMFSLFFIGAQLYVKAQTKRSEQRRAVVTSQMQALRAQMNPHFMFNALNSVQRLILTSDVNGALQALNTFAKLVRMSLESTIKPYHTLKSEVEWLTLYLDLEKLRYGNKLTYQLSVDETIQQEIITVPTMLIQPFIENSIRHGIFHKPTSGLVRIEFLPSDKDTICCEITDDGVGRVKARELTQAHNLPTTSVGITSTSERVRLINEGRKSKRNISIDIQDLYESTGEAQGTKVTIIFPIDSLDEI
jgi:ligand-binding sensor domain-containing protein